MIKKIHGKKLVTRRKLAYMNGYHGAFFDAEQLSNYLRITKAHAYRIIKDPSKLSKKHKQLLDVHAFGQLTGFEKGWVCKNDRLESPDGYPITQTDLENFIWLKQTGLLKSMVEEMAHKA